MSEQATEAGPLTREQAVELLIERPEPVEQPEAQAEAGAEGEENTEGESTPPDDASEALEPGDGEEAETLETEAAASVDAPQWWTTEDRAEFAKLTPELQAIVVAQEGKREAVVAKSKAEAAEKIRVADAEMGKVAQLAEGLAEKLPQWVQAFEANWGTQAPDWDAIAEEHGTEQATRLKFRFDREQASLTEARQATERAQVLAEQTYFKTEFTKLAQIAPDLADPTTGPTKRAEVSQFLAGEGFAPEVIHKISAAEMSLARDAMLYRKSKAALAAKPTPAPAPIAKAPVRPAAAVPMSDPQKREAQRLQNRFAQTSSREDAVALILAKGL